MRADDLYPRVFMRRGVWPSEQKRVGALWHRPFSFSWLSRILATRLGRASSHTALTKAATLFVDGFVRAVDPRSASQRIYRW